MLRLIMLTAAVLVGAVAQAATSVDVAKGEAVLTMRVDGQLSIDAQGNVLDYQIRTKLEPQVEKLVRRAVPGWRFKPIQVDGKPVIAESPMRITLTAVEMEQGYKVMVDNVVFRPNTREEWDAEDASRKARPRMSVEGETPKPLVWITHKSMQPPSYPSGLMKSGVGGIVLLTLRLNPDGTVAEVFASQSSLLNVKGSAGLLDRARLMLERSASSNAKRWTFAVAAEDMGSLSASDLTVRVPVEYSLGTPTGPDNIDGRWRQEFRGPNQLAPWLPAEKAATVGVSDLKGNEILAGVSPFELSDRGVIGAVL